MHAQISISRMIWWTTPNIQPIRRWKKRSIDFFMFSLRICCGDVGAKRRPGHFSSFPCATTTIFSPRQRRWRHHRSWAAADRSRGLRRRRGRGSVFLCLRMRVSWGWPSSCPRPAERRSSPGWGSRCCLAWARTQQRWCRRGGWRPERMTWLGCDWGWPWGPRRQLWGRWSPRRSHSSGLSEWGLGLRREGHRPNNTSGCSPLIYRSIDQSSKEQWIEELCDSPEN